MTELEQQIALCEWSGWKPVPPPDFIKDAGVVELWKVWIKDREKRSVENLPNTNSLDVLHEMEKKLTVEQASDYYWKLKEIQPVVGAEPCEHWVYHCTSAQRREALLKTLNLWKA